MKKIFLFVFLINSLICLNLRDKRIIKDFPIERNKFKYHTLNRNNLKYFINRSLILFIVIICYIIKKVKSCKEEEKEGYIPLKKKSKKNKYYTIPKKEIIEEKIIKEQLNEEPSKSKKVFQE
jgi:hypothetical protein